MAGLPKYGSEQHDGARSRITKTDGWVEDERKNSRVTLQGKGAELYMIFLAQAA